MLIELPMRIVVTARHKKKQRERTLQLLLRDISISLPVRAQVEIWRDKQCFYQTGYSDAGKHTIHLAGRWAFDTVIVIVECEKYVKKDETFYLAFCGEK